MRVRIQRDIPTLGGTITKDSVVYARENAGGRFDLFRDAAMTQMLACNVPRSQESQELEEAFDRLESSRQVRQWKRNAGVTDVPRARWYRDVYGPESGYQEAMT